MPKTPETAASFNREFDASPTAIAFAPGWVNLIGEHTDYNDGLVLPMAVQFGVYAAGRLTDTGHVRAISRNFPGQAADFSVGSEPHGTTWDHYLRAILAELIAACGKPTGLELYFLGDVPTGAGLSSSAAFGVATAMLVAELVGEPWRSKVALAKLCQTAEHRTGVMCGLLDQMASAACLAGSAMLLDCRDLTRTMIPLQRENLAVIVGDTGVKRQLIDGRYNQRRRECEAAARAFGVRALRDVTEDDLQRARGKVEDALLRRARHNVTENQRVKRFAVALTENDFATLGRLANESHASLRDDFEVSCPELDAMTEAFGSAGAWGARLIGAGFGGAAIALANPAAATSIIDKAQATYRQQTGLSGAFHVVTPGDGARVAFL